MMTPQELKNSILQMAIQGKLVEQREEEGTAEELYQKIQKEKQRLIEEGKIKREKPLPEIVDDEIPFEIPKNWKWVRWGDLSQSIQYGYNAQAKDTGNIKMVRISDIQEGEVIWNSVPYCDIRKEEIQKYILCKNDILFARTGGTVGKSFLVKEVPEESIYAGYLIRTRYSEYLVPEYLIYYMNSQLYWNQLREGTIATAQPNCNGKTLAKMIVPLPPIREQRRIVEKIEELLPYIEQYDIAYTKLEDFNKRFPEDMKKSILQMAIQGKLVKQREEEGTAEELYQKIQEEKKRLIEEGKIKKEKPTPEIVNDEIPFEIPKSWKWVRWGDLSQSIQYGYNAQAKETGKIRMVRISDIQEGEVIWNNVPYCDIEDEEIQKYILCKNDILFARTGGTVGKSFLVKEVPEESIYAGYLIRTRYSVSLVPEYLIYYMNSQLYWSQLRAGTIATAQPNCNGKTLANMLIPLPPLCEQERIVTKIKELILYCDQLYFK